MCRCTWACLPGRQNEGSGERLSPILGLRCRVPSRKTNKVNILTAEDEEEGTDCYSKSLRTPPLRFSFRENVNTPYIEGSNYICLTDRGIEEALYIFT